MLLWTKHISIILFAFIVLLRARFKDKQRKIFNSCQFCLRGSVWSCSSTTRSCSHLPAVPGELREEAEEAINYLCMCVLGNLIMWLLLQYCKSRAASGRVPEGLVRAMVASLERWVVLQSDQLLSALNIFLFSSYCVELGITWQPHGSTGAGNI